MKRQIKSLKCEGNRVLVGKLPCTAEALVDKLVSPEIEWVYSYESPLVEPLIGKDFHQMVFGACDIEHGVIHVFLDNILKTYGLTGLKPIEHWFTVRSTNVLVHELIHYLCPEWTEEQVGVATEKFMEAWLNPLRKATKLIIHVGDRTFEHLLTEDSQVLEVKD